MKFLDKVKNMFTEEVEEVEKPKDEVRIEQIIPEEITSSCLGDHHDAVRTSVQNLHRRSSPGTGK